MATMKPTGPPERKEYFYGFKVQLITTADNQLVDYFITAGSFHDSTALQAMQINLPVGSDLYGDIGYTDYQQEDLYAECDQIYLKIHPVRQRGKKIRCGLMRLGRAAGADVFLKK